MVIDQRIDTHTLTCCLDEEEVSTYHHHQDGRFFRAELLEQLQACAFHTMAQCRRAWVVWIYVYTPEGEALERWSCMPDGTRLSWPTAPVRRPAATSGSDLAVLGLTIAWWVMVAAMSWHGLLVFAQSMQAFPA